MATVALATDDSFEQLYREHAPTVYRYALGTVGNPVDAEDVAQATFTCALRAIRGGLRPEKPENWLISIAHNECRQRFRRLGRRAPEVPLEPDVPAYGSDAADAAETSEEIGDVLHALAELPFNQRAALVLREVSGRSASEIAECLGTSRAAVDMLVFRARQTIRTNLAGVRALALVPLPRSLLSFLGGSATSTGAVAAGAGAAAKLVAAAVAAVAVATGGGSTETAPARPAGPGPAPNERVVAPHVPERALRRDTRVPGAKVATAPAPVQRDATAPPVHVAAPVPAAPAVSAPAEVAPPPQVSLPGLLAKPAAEPPQVPLPAVPELPQLPPGLPEGAPTPGVTLPDAGTPALP